MKIKRSTFNRWRKIFVRTIILAIFFGAFYLYFRTNFFTIYNYEIVGAPLNTKAEIQNKIQDLAKIPIYKVIPTNKIFTYSKLI